MTQDLSIQITSVTAAQWADAGHTLIDCQVQFSHLPTPVPFTTSASDTEPHAQALWTALNAGTFGTIADYAANPAIAQAQLVAAATVAMAACDRVAIRCAKKGVPFTADWVAYDLALANIVGGKDTTSTTLPTKPSSYPAGS